MNKNIIVGTVDEENFIEQDNAKELRLHVMVEVGPTEKH